MKRMDMNSKAQRWRFRAGLLAGLAILLGVFDLPVASGADPVPAGEGTNQIFRMAVTASMFSEVNETDARAAMKVWIMALSTERQIPVDPDPLIFRNLDELTNACQTRSIDGVGLMTSEYLRLSRTMKFDRLGVSSVEGRIGEVYVVLVRQDSGIVRLNQLQGRTLNVLDTARTSLATVWLDTALVEAGLNPCARWFKQIKRSSKASLVTLPVFFHQADACLTTSNSFKVMGELNPQVASQLRALATSPELMPVFFAFREHERSPLSPQIFEAMEGMHETSAGKQILTLVKADRIVAEPVSCLNSSLELLARHERLCGEENPADRSPNEPGR